MSIFGRISTDWTTYRKEKLEGSGFLGVLVAEIRRVAKDDGQRDVTDADCLSVLKKFAKGLTITIEELKKGGRSFENEEKELELVNSYLPVALSTDQLKEEVSKIVEELGVKGSMKAIGQVMSKLKKNFEGQYDGREASEIVKEILK